MHLHLLPVLRDRLGCVLLSCSLAATVCPAADIYPAESPPAPESGPVLAPPIEKQKFHLGPWEQDIGYTQAIRVGNTLYVSGSTGRGSMPDAIKHAYDVIARTLAAHHLGFGHVVKENVFTTNIEALKASKAVRNAYYGDDFPAATWVQVSRLFAPEIVLEVEVTAVFPDAPPGVK